MTDIESSYVFGLGLGSVGVGKQEPCGRVQLNCSRLGSTQPTTGNLVVPYGICRDRLKFLKRSLVSVLAI